MKFDSNRLSRMLDGMGVPDMYFHHDNEGRRIDAALSVVFARQLEYVQKDFEATVYPELIARDVIPVVYDVPEGATAYTYTRLEEIGEADFITDSAADYPNIEVSGVQVTARIIGWGDSYQYSVREAKSAALAGVQLDSEKANAARKAIERRLDAVALTGVVQANLPGLLNSALVTPVAVVGDWADPATTGESIFNDIQRLWTDIYIKSGAALEPDTLLLPTAGYSAVNTRFMGPNDRRTVKEALAAGSTFQTIKASQKLNLANAALTGPRMVAYKYDKSILRLTIPQEIQSSEPQAVARSFRVFSDMYSGGTQIRNPMGIAYADSMIGS